MRYACLSLLMMATTVVASGQVLPDKISFEHIPVPGTIHSSLTEDILQDPYGMIWIGKDALYRYNGREFTKYEVIEPDSGLFSSREITRFHWEAKNNRLLIGTRNYGLAYYDYATDRINRFQSKNGVPIVSDIAIADDQVWVTSFTSGFFRLEKDTLVKIPALNEHENPTQMVVMGNSVWVGCLNEIIVLQHGKVRRKIPLATFKGYYPNAIRSSTMLFDKRGYLWVGTERDGVLVLDTATNKLFKRFSSLQPPFYNSINRIVEDEAGLIWVATKGDGIVVYSPEKDQFIQVSKTDFDDGSISGDNCTSICMDRSGIVWIGSSGDLNKYDRHKVKFAHYYHDTQNKNSLSDDNIRNVYQDDEGIIYAATTGGFLNRIDRKKNTVDAYEVMTGSSKVHAIPVSVIGLNSQTLLVGTSEGLFQFNKTTHKFSYYPPLAAATQGKPIRQIIRSGSEFIMTLQGKVLTYNIETGATSIYGKEAGIITASCVAMDPQHRLWVGTRDGAVYAGPARQKFSRVYLERDKDRPDSSFFLTLSIQPVGNELWVNSFINGIYVIDLTQDPPRVVERITTKNGLPDNTVYATIPDGFGKVWISHNSGLSQYDLQTHKFVHFSVSEGLQDEEFNRLAFYQSPKGEIMLGGINGLNVFNPSEIKLPKTNLDVKLINVVSFPSRSVESKRETHSLLAGTTDFKLPFTQNSVQFNFFVPDFHDPVRYEIRYKLEPWDQNWIDTDKLNSALYTNLNPGSYTFSVKAIDINGEEAIRTVHFSIAPPFYRTWWFIVLTALVCSFLVYSIIYSSVQSNKREKKRLEELLTARTREIERSREELENLNSKKDLIFSILSHDLRSPLTTLKGFLGLLIENSDALSKEDLQKYATNIRNSVTTSLDLIDNTLFWSLSQTGNIQYNPTTVPLEPMFEKIRGLYQLTAERKHITMHFGAPTGLLVHGDENMVYVLLRNLVSNAIKFTPEMNTIHVDAFQQNGHVSVTVKDSGIGMSAEEVAKIIQLENPMVKKGTSSEKGTGLGLVLCRKFVEMNRGKMTIESQPGVGSTFTVVLPSATSAT